MYVTTPRCDRKHSLVPHKIAPPSLFIPAHLATLCWCCSVVLLFCNISFVRPSSMTERNESWMMTEGTQGNMSGENTALKELAFKQF